MNFKELYTSLIYRVTIIKFFSPFLAGSFRGGTALQGSVLMLSLGMFMLSDVEVMAQAYDSDTLQYELREIEIRATRETETEAGAPFSVSVVTRPLVAQRTEPAFSFDRIASSIPGLWVNDRQNYALGERVSIRGMGWRTAFGVRGIYVLMDDIPLTVPDGQTVMDILDPAMVRQLEVIRGPSSSFWGNAGGGTLFLSTRPASYEPSFSSRIYGGAFGTYSAQISGSHREGPRGYHLNTSYLYRDGYRNHSKHQAFRMTGHMDWEINEQTNLKVSGAFVDAPDTRHPGSLSASDLEINRRQATPFFENASAGKTWRQGQLGVTLRSETVYGEWQGTTYGIARSLHNPLPFADIEVDRLTGGTRWALMNNSRFIKWGVGADASIQSDDRRNYGYVGSFERGGLELDQQETVLNGALFARAKTGWNKFNISGGIRLDAIRFESDDRLQTDGEDQSGHRTFQAVSPSVGVSYQISPGLIYSNFGTSFETPTTTELVNRPDMDGGFNTDIKPERAQGLDAGFRGGWPAVNLRYDIAVFRMNVQDQLVSYRTEEGGDRDFYDNAGETRHDGLELALNWRGFPWMEIMANYTWSHFTFRESVDTDQVTFTRGNRLPGVPEHRLMSALTWMPLDYRISLKAEILGSYYVDNANEHENPGFEVFHIHLAHSGIEVSGQLSVSPFLMLNNIADARYNSSVSINANNDRYYEPAPGRSVYAGFSLDF
ncbi:MAG: TonB-dependent receptor [Balneolales bacterium]